MSQQCTPHWSPKGQGPAGPRGEFGLGLWTSSAGCGIVIFLLLVSAPWWVEVGLEACAGFLAGGTGACPLVGGTGSWLSCGQDLV